MTKQSPQKRVKISNGRSRAVLTMIKPPARADLWLLELASEAGLVPGFDLGADKQRCPAWVRIRGCTFRRKRCQSTGRDRARRCRELLVDPPLTVAVTSRRIAVFQRLHAHLPLTVPSPRQNACTSGNAPRQAMGRRVLATRVGTRLMAALGLVPD